LNFLAHAWVLPDGGGRHRFSGEPELVLGSALPDLLSAFDRRAPRLAGDAVPALEAAGASELARGVRAHQVADACFHDLPAFREACSALRPVAGRLNAAGEKVRGFFLAHIVLEVLLDAVLLERELDLALHFYGSLEQADVAAAVRATSEAAGSPRDERGFARFATRFVEARFLEDYREDAGATKRVARVLERARQPLGPRGEALLLDEIPGARTIVRERADSLLSPVRLGVEQALVRPRAM